MSAAPPLDVVKVGGSLFDLDGFPERIDAWLRRRSHRRSLLVVGGGQPAQYVRAVSRRFVLSEKKAHGLAIRAMQFQARLLTNLVSNLLLFPEPPSGADWPRRSTAVVLDPWTWLQSPEAPTLPIGWHVTSDSIAATLARTVGAERLVLLKSVGGDEPMDLDRAVARGWLDAYFPFAIGDVAVEWINFRRPVSPT